MVFESEQEIYDKLKSVRQIPDWVSKAREYHKTLKALFYGDKFKELILKIEHIESDKHAAPRLKYARSIQDICAKIVDPISNVYSATGFNKDIKASDADKKKLYKELSNVRGGYSLEKWLQVFWSKDLYIIDPSGLIVLEWNTEKAFPTYKSIDCIRDYGADGLDCEYIIYEPKDAPDGSKIWRVVDDVKIYQIKQIGETYKILDDETIDVPFGRCPGRVNSDKIQLGKKGRLSFVDNIIGALKEILRDRSILTIYKFKNGFSTPYRPGIICPDCKGTKKKGIDDCPTCDGKGELLHKDVVDEIIVPIDLTADNPIQLPSDFAGWITPDLTIWNQYKNGIKEDSMTAFEAAWGTKESEAKDQTAMSVILNTQPMEVKLNHISDIAESQDKAISEMLANFYLTKGDESICIYSYGRNYIVQPPEYILEQYQKSTEAKDPLLIRDNKMRDYITSKFKNDPENLRIQLIKKYLEPYVHYDIELVKDIYGIQEAQKKGLFVEWWETLKRSDYDKTKEVLEKEMNAYFTIKLTAIEPLKQ